MKLEEQKTFSEMLKAVFGVYSKDVSPMLLGIWWSALERYELNDVRRALNFHVSNPKSGQFLPKPADVVRFIDGDPQTRSLAAWSKVQKAIRIVGCYQTVAFDDPLIHNAIEKMGGWTEFSSMLSDDEPFKAREFQKHYEAAVEHPPERYQAKLMGHAEINNRANGFQDSNDKVVLIGDQSKAQLVLEQGSDHGFLQIGHASSEKKASNITNIHSLVNKLIPKDAA